MLGLMYRTIGSSNKEAFTILYKTLVRPIREYATPVWCPYIVKDIIALEKIQRRESRLALGQKRGDMEYEDRFKILVAYLRETQTGFLPLVTVFGLNNLNFSGFFELTKHNCT